MSELEINEQFIKDVARQLNSGQGCKVSDELAGVPFDEQLRILKKAEAVANTELNSQVLAVSALVRIAFNEVTISAGRTHSKVLGQFFPPKDYQVTLNLEDGTISKDCKRE